MTPWMRKVLDNRDATSRGLAQRVDELNAGYNAAGRPQIGTSTERTYLDLLHEDDYEEIQRRYGYSD